MKTILTFILIITTITTASAQLLTDEELETKKIYSSFEDALDNPSDVYVMEIGFDSFDPSNGDTVIPPEIFDLPNLQKLNFTYGGPYLKEIPSEIKRADKVTDMSIFLCSWVEEVPPEINELKNLRHLYISHCPIRELPDIGQLQQLQTLCIWSCPLEELPPSLTQLQKLEVLEVHGSLQHKNDVRDTLFMPISALPEDMGNMTNLKYLDLSYTRVQYLPASIVNCSNLTEISLKGTCFDNIPEQLFELATIVDHDVLLRCHNGQFHKIVHQSKRESVGIRVHSETYYAEFILK
ncbi:MAG: leucine-rich repeat domain-containing protein [Crocinitomicaceae bacterium]|nr:leucine-rich repeat domain-containing protein [Crocinitomicaceae bacterium]